MKLCAQDRIFIRRTLWGIADTEEALRMKTFVQHGHISTYQHVMNVVCMSCLLNRRLHLRADRKSLVRGAFLHDYYLYDWHDRSVHAHWHGFRHPMTALANAEKRFCLSPTERNIIASHMWPLTLTRLPRCREAAIVCAADKLCALYETILRDKPLFETEE